MTIGKERKEGKDDEETIARGWSKLTVTTSVRSLGKNFLSTGAEQSSCKPVRKDLEDLKEFSIGSQTSRRFHPRFRVTRTPLPHPSISFPSGNRVVSYSPEYAIPIRVEWNANHAKMARREDAANRWCNFSATRKLIRYGWIILTICYVSLYIWKWRSYFDLSKKLQVYYRDRLSISILID